MTDVRQTQSVPPPDSPVPAWDSQKTNIMDRLEQKLDRQSEKITTEFKDVRNEISSLKSDLSATKEGQKWVKGLLWAIVIPTWIGVVSAILKLIFFV